MDNGDRPATGHGWAFLKEMNEHQTNNGLSKREHFAGLAMQAHILGGNNDTEDVANWAIEQADALLKELER